MTPLTHAEHVVALRLYHAIKRAILDDPNEDPALVLATVAQVLVDVARHAQAEPTAVVAHVAELLGAHVRSVPIEDDDSSDSGV